MAKNGHGLPARIIGQNAARRWYTQKVAIVPIAWGGRSQASAPKQAVKQHP